MNIHDSYLSNANGDAAAQLSGFGKQILDAQKAAADDWASRIDMFLPKSDDLLGLPDGSWLLQTEVELAKPFTSKADNPWFEGQNPIVRDHLTGLPVVKPTTWKGHLSFAAMSEGLDPAVRGRLFGTSLGAETGLAGRLHFFTTFFLGEPGREVVTPLWRDTRTPARGPLACEVLGSGRTGTFNLLYVPRPKGPKWSVRQVTEDLEAATAAVKSMLIDYGFSAKKTAGWGVVKDAVQSGTLAAKGAMWPAARAAGHQFVEPEESFRKFMDERGQPHAALKKPTGQWLSNQEFKTAGAALGTLTEYKKFRAWYDAHGSEWVRRLGSPMQQGVALLQVFEFSKVSELPALATRLATGLKEASGG